MHETPTEQKRSTFPILQIYEELLYNQSETTSIADFKFEGHHRVAIVSKISNEAKGFKSQL